jgi:ribosomal protein S18 acetylase RimI-like enzyme
MMTGTVRTALPAESELVAEILCAAFQDDPISTWLFPDHARRRTGANPAFFATIVEHALAAGRIDITADEDAVLVWTPGAAEPDDDDDDGHPIPGLDMDEMARLGVLFGLMTRHAPTGEYEHAEFLAVRPQRQGAGVGGELFRHGLERYDTAGVPTYLEASSPRNAKLYRRLGFRDHGEGFHLPGGGPPMQPMWRDPA